MIVFLETVKAHSIYTASLFNNCTLHTAEQGSATASCTPYLFPLELEVYTVPLVCILSSMQSNCNVIIYKIFTTWYTDNMFFYLHYLQKKKRHNYFTRLDQFKLFQNVMIDYNVLVAFFLYFSFKEKESAHILAQPGLRLWVIIIGL